MASLFNTRGRTVSGAPMPNVAFSGIQSGQLQNSVPKIRTPQLQPVGLTGPIDVGGTTFTTAMKGVQRTSSAVMNTALRVEDERLTLEANEAFLNYRNLIRAIQYDQELGYFTKTGKSAVLGLESYKSEVTTASKEIIGSVSPAVQTRLLPKILQEQNQALDLGSKYSVRQNQVRKTNVRSAMEADVMSKIGEVSLDTKNTVRFIESSANAMFTPDAFTGQLAASTMLEKTAFRNKAYGSALQATLQSPGGGAQTGLAQYQAYKKLGLQPSTLSKMVSAITTQMKTERARDSAVESAETKARKEIGTQARIDFYEDLVKGQPLNTSVLDGYVRGEYIGPDAAVSIRNRFETRDTKDEEVSFDPVEFGLASMMIERDQLPTLEKLDRVAANPALRDQDMLYLMKEVMSVSSVQDRETYKQGKEELRGIILKFAGSEMDFMRKYLYGSGPTQQEFLEYTAAERDMRQRLKANESLTGILNDYKERYGLLAKSVDGLPMLPNGVNKPTTELMLQAQQRALVVKIKDKTATPEDIRTLSMLNDLYTPILVPKKR